MRRRAGFFLLLALFFSGCVHVSNAGGVRVAQAEPQVCKHCNCYMPAGIRDETPCTVCNCGYRAGKCYRGR